MKIKPYIYKKIFLFTLISGFLYGEKMVLDNGISEKIDNLVEKKRTDNLRDARLKILFEAIKRHNNKFALEHLATKENIIKRNEETEKNKYTENEGVYGPDYSEIIKIVKERRENQELIDINSHDSDGFSAIIVAIEYKNNELLKILIENGADIYEKHPVFDRLTLHTACYYENEEAVELILKTYPKLINMRSGHDGWSPLHDAVLKSNSEIVKILLKYGADPMIKDNSGGTPMDMATEFGKGEIVKLLRDEIKKRRK